MNQNTTPAPQLEQIPIAAIDPDPANRRSSLPADFVNSIREHGVLEPILVIPHPDHEHRYLLVAGERRWRAATKAGLTQIPAVVHHSMDEKARVEAQVTENLQRADMQPCQEGQQLLRLIQLGHTIKTLAKAVGRTQNHVRTRIKLTELPATAQKLINDGTWTIQGGLDALQLLDHPEQLTDLIQSGTTNPNHYVNRALRQIDYDQFMDDLNKQTERDGLRVVEELPRSAARLNDLGIDPDDHASEDCHAHIVTGSRDWGTPRLVPICTSARRHRTEGNSEVKAPNRPGTTEEERIAVRQKREASEARRIAMKAALTGRLNKGDCYPLILSAFITSAHYQEQEAVIDLLQIFPAAGTNPTRVLADYANESDTTRIRAALALAMVRHEEAHSSGRGHSDQWLAWLEARGYEPADADQDRLSS